MYDWFSNHYGVLKDFSAPVLTIVGFAITTCLAIAGLNTFEKWKREKIEERRIDVALEALSIAYESQDIFAAIRNPGSFDYEHDDMPGMEGESDDDRRRRATFYVTLKRMHDQREFFLKVLRLRPRLMAMFGPEVQQIFVQLNEARAHVQVAAQMLMRPDFAVNMTEQNQRLRNRMEADVWSGLGDVYTEEELPGGDRVLRKVEAFRDDLVKLCRPIVDHQYGKRKSP